MPSAARASADTAVGALRFSCIVPVLDEAGSIAALLAALEPLRAAGHELILVDGGSRDGTPALAAGRVDRLLTSAPGRGRQLNAGLQAARGDMILFLHADTRLPDDALALMADARAAGHCWGRFDVRLSGRRRLLRVVERMMNWRSRLTGIATGDQAIFATRAALAQAGGVPEWPLMEDVELSRRLKRLGRPACVRTPVVTSSRRWEANGILRTILLMWGLRLAFALGASPEWLARRYYGRRG